MSAERNQGEYLEQLEQHPIQAAIAIDKAINLLAPGASHTVAAKLFDNRVHWTTVRAWRRGWNSTPRWALDLMAAKLLAHGAAFHAAAELAQLAPGFTVHGGGKAGAQTLNRWRAAQAAKKNATKV